MKGKLVVILIYMLSAIFIFAMSVSIVRADELDAWEFRFFGINAKDFEDRKVLPIIGGIITSLAVHEAGHLIVGELTGADSSIKWDSDENMIVANNYWGDDWSEDKAAITASAGFLFQTGVGAIFTAIPTTRHSDFMVGFNGFSSLTGLVYGITDGVHSDNVSDVERMNEYWCDGSGTATALGSFIVNGYFTYISLDKHKEN